jgi:DNA-binding transcriptional MocR family regulator
MYVPLDRDSPHTLARQISAYLAELIRHGLLGPSSRLPPTRKLAQSLGVGRSTVEAAYEELEARKLVTVRPGNAAIVRRSIPADTAQLLPFPEARGRDPLPSEAWLAADVPQEVFDLAGAGPRLPTVPPRQLRSFHADALSAGRGPLFSPPPPLGESALRAAASRHLARCGILRGAEELAVLPSRPDAMERLLRLFVPVRGLVLADALLDPDLAAPLRARKARVLVLPQESMLRSLPPRLSPRLLVVATGESRLPGRPPDLARRRALLDLAKQRGIPVVEDVTRTDAMAAATVPLAVLDPSGRVFPLCDLSDEIGGGLGACVVGAGPKALERLRAGAPSSGTPPGRLSQRVLASALDSPGRARAVRKLREQRKLLEPSVARALHRRLPQLGGHEFSAGSDAVRLDLPEDVTGSALQEAARGRGVLVRSARDCGAGPAADRFVLLDLTRLEEGELLEGIRRLGETLDALCVSSRGASGDVPAGV